jgi:hypothetical protein
VAGIGGLFFRASTCFGDNTKRLTDTNQYATSSPRADSAQSIVPQGSRALPVHTANVLLDFLIGREDIRACVYANYVHRICRTV